MEVYIAPFEAATQALRAMVEHDVLLIRSGDGSDDVPNPDAPEPVSVELSFDVPNEDFVNGLGGRPVINLYLYRMQEKQALRYSENYQKMVNDKSCQHKVGRRPRFVELFYAVTIWTRPHKNQVFTELNLMSRFMQGIGKYEFVPERYIEPTGFEVNPYGIPMMFFSDDPVRSQAEFWSSLGSTPKSMIPLSLTVPVSLHEPIETPFVDIINRGYRLPDSDAVAQASSTALSLSGRVTDTEGEPLDSARVFVQQSTFADAQVQQVQTQTYGCYRFYGLRSGPYEFWAETLDDQGNTVVGPRRSLTLQEDEQGNVLPEEQDITLSV